MSARHPLIAGACLVAAGCAPLRAQLSLSQTAGMACPAAITVHESAAPVAGWKAESGDGQHPFERISVYNGDGGGREYDLAPDTDQTAGRMVTQTWDLPAYREMRLFLRCLYRGTAATLSLELPGALKVCAFRYKAGADGGVLSDARMSCR